MDLMIEDLMEQLVEMGGSDMHIQAGAPVYFRVSGKLAPIDDEPLLQLTYVVSWLRGAAGE